MSDYSPEEYQPSKLNEVLERIAMVKQSSKLPIVLFDLDSTLFDTAPRNLRILSEFAADIEQNKVYSAESKSALSTASARVTLADLGWNYKAPLLKYLAEDPTYTEHEAVQKEVEDMLGDLQAYWEVHFFSDEYVALDLPTPGAAPFAQEVHAAGALVYYLTGRHVSSSESVVVENIDNRSVKLVVTPGMEFGTARALTTRGFPFWRGRCELHLKPDFTTDDTEFKQSAINYVKDLDGMVVATFDNEPGNCNMFRANFPGALNFFLDTVHSPAAPPPDKELIKLGDFSRQ